MNINEKVKQYHDDVIRVRRHLHQYPELSQQEYETCAYLRNELDKAGIPYDVTPSGRSIVATIKGDYPGKTICLRGDIDALPIEEATGLPFSSCKKGVMHACGHDAHGAMALGTALILNDMRSRLHGTAKIIFQEAEETMFGALHVLESGLIDDCDNSIMLHVAVDHDTGVFLVNYGVRCAKVGSCKIFIDGRAGHSSRPEQAVNPIIIASKIIDAIADITAYELPRSEYVVFSPTVIKSGTKENIIPGSCYIEANARYFDDKFDEFLSRRITEISENIARAMGGSAKVEFTPEGTPMINDDASTERAINIIKRLWGEDKIDYTPPGLFGDDFAFIQKRFPGVVVNLGAAKDGKYTIGHNEHMMVDEDCMDIGVEFLTTYIAEYLGAAEK